MQEENGFNAHVCTCMKIIILGMKRKRENKRKWRKDYGRCMHASRHITSLRMKLINFLVRHEELISLSLH